MNILILNWKDLKHPEVGGAEIIVYELARRLVRDGHEVTWFCRNFKGGKGEEMVDGIKIVRRGTLYSTYLRAPIYYWLLRKKPDVVIDMSNTIYWQTPLWALLSKKIAYLNQLAQEVFDYEYPKLVGVVGKIIERIQYVTYRSIPFICYSNSTKQDLAVMGIKPEQVSLFRLGIDHKRYIPGKKSTTPLFICVSRLVKMKRTDLVIKAFASVHKQVPGAKLVIIGYGYERQRLENLRNELGLNDVVYFADENILFFDKTAKDVKVKYMQKAWALIFPSVKEGWGMTVTECAACGTPTIATDVTGLRDSLVDGKTGILVSSDPTSEELAEAIIRISKNKSLRQRLSKEAIAWSKRFDWEVGYQEFKKILDRKVATH